MVRLAAITLVLGVTVGCGNSSESTPKPPEVRVDTSIQTPTQAPDPARIVRMWSGSCALCHVDGTAGAPVVGRVEDWAPRLAQGRETLLVHTIEGYNNMPPLGYCMACETADFLSMIDLMTRGISPREPKP